MTRSGKASVETSKIIQMKILSKMGFIIKVHHCALQLLFLGDLSWEPLKWVSQAKAFDSLPVVV